MTTASRIRRYGASVLLYVLTTALALAMVYPLLWLVGASFKPNNEIFTSLRLLPKEWVVSSYRTGWTASSQVPFSRFFYNSLVLVSSVVCATIVSSSFVGYGFARFTFPLKRPLFAVMISSLMIPAAVLVLPRFVMYRDFGWIDTYRPFIVPALFANSAFFVFMFVQFFRSIPREYDESAYLDGCGTLAIFARIIVPLAKPAFASAIIFQFIWTWNDFFGPLVYINTVKKFPVSLGLKMTLDTNTSFVAWNSVLAMAVVAMLPNILVYFIAQKQFVQGVATTGLKG